MGLTPRLTAAMWKAQPAPAAKPGRFKKMHASSTKRVTVSPLLFVWMTFFLAPWNCHSSGVRVAAAFSTRRASFLSTRCAP
jgi:hypothetical protein